MENLGVFVGYVVGLCVGVAVGFVLGRRRLPPYTEVS